jgi:hypothetical protein
MYRKQQGSVMTIEERHRFSFSYKGADETLHVLLPKMGDYILYAEKV